MKKFRRHSARMNLMHYRVLVRRYFRQIFSTLGTLLPLILQAPVMLIIVYLVCSNDAFTQKNAAALTNANVTVFVLIVMSALMGILNSYREICKERDVLSREVFGGLDLSAYVLSKFTVLSVIGIVQCVILYGGTLTFVDFAYPDPATGYLCSVAAMILTNISVMAVGLFISALLKKSESAILPVLFIIIMQVVFCDSLFALGDPGQAGCAILRPPHGALRYSATPAASTTGHPKFSKRKCSDIIRSSVSECLQRLPFYLRFLPSYG